MAPSPQQIGENLAKFFADFGTSDRTVKSAARRMKISESSAAAAAREYDRASLAIYESVDHGRNPARERFIRESAGRLAERANAAEAKGLRNASLQELEALTTIGWGSFR
jgi:DNA-binding transcriptional regulator PaaX